jgi:hypothetical protein
MPSVIVIFAQIQIFVDRSFGNYFAEFPENMLRVVDFQIAIYS